jgi:hypothetical protein
MKYLTIGVFSFALALSACSDAELGTGTYDEDDLAVGSTGPKVREVFDYLTRYGYFENATLREQIQGWQPIVRELPAEPDVFDDVHEDGVRSYQKLMGLSVTGVVDAPTRTLMAKPRCTHPDYDPERMDPEQKFFINEQFGDWTQQYAFTRFLGIGSEAQRFIAARRKWTDVSELTLTEVTVNDPRNFRVHAADLGACRDVAAQTAFTFPHDITFNTRCDWNVVDYESVAVHELGHALGLGHSGFTTSVMYPMNQGLRSLSKDDIQAIGVTYSNWVQTAGLAWDISIGADGWIWAIGIGQFGSEGFEIWRADTAVAGPVWERVGGIGGNKIAAIGRNSALTIRKVNGTPQLWEFSGAINAWIPRSSPPNLTCTDIAVSNMARPWCMASNGFAYVFDPASGNWVQQGTAVRADLATYRHNGALLEIPWKVATDGRIYRKVPEVQGWQQTPALPGGVALDIGVGDDGSVWAAGGEAAFGARSIFIWNEQPPATVGQPHAPKRFHWVKVSGGATDVAVTPQGIPWVLANNAIYRRLRQ